MKDSEVQKLAEKNLALQHKLISENASALDMVYFLLQGEAKKVYDLLKDKLKIDQTASYESSPAYATATFTHDEHEKIMNFLYALSCDKLGVLENKVLKNQREIVHKNKPLLEILQ